MKAVTKNPVRSNPGKTSKQPHFGGVFHLVENMESRIRTRKEGTLLFEIQPPFAKGAPTRIMKGDKFPFMGIPLKLVWLYKQEGDLFENLMAHAVKSPEAQEYLATEEGKAETQRWVQYIAENAPDKIKAD